MKLIKTSYAMVACLSLATATAGFAQEREEQKPSARAGQESSAQRGQQGEVAAMDKAWTQMSAASDKAEIQLSKAAQEKASSEQVKQFAARMVEDHTKNSQELKQIASQNKIELKDQLPEEKRSLIQEITSKSGEEFDQAYMDYQLAAHRMAVAHYKNGADLLKDQELKSFAQKALPKLEQHLSMIEKQSPRTTQRQQPGQPETGTAGSRPGTGQPTQPGQQPQQPQQPQGGQVGTPPQQ